MVFSRPGVAYAVSRLRRYT